jgi:2-polyprenyl-3-methyl-5-hydroxy-6-metoxy-1,4-benzoquinol methylase
MGVEQPASYYDAIYRTAKKYNRHYTGVRWLPLFERAKELLTKGNILELGCGVGQFAHLIYDSLGRDYTGIDFSKEAIDRCKAKNLKGYHFIQGDVYKVLQYDNFDNVVALETFEHLNDIEIISNIPSGKHLVISLPTFKNEAHLIWFDNESQIIDRYKNLIKIEAIELISDWFLFSGKKI